MKFLKPFLLLFLLVTSIFAAFYLHSKFTKHRVYIFAMEEEFKKYKPMIEKIEKRTLNPVQIEKNLPYKLFYDKVYIAISQEGCDAAAYVTHDLLARFNVSEIINIGSCGGRKNRVKIEDIILVSKIYDSDFFVPKKLKEPFVIVNEFNILQGLFKTREGVLGSGDQFVMSDANLPAEVDIVDMEAYSIQFVADRFKVPVYFIKIVSDYLDYNQFKSEILEHKIH
ncbi:TPA: hypothetical protein DEO28_04710 [Candidatus Dependentiae bacterium]|nr:MAG: hypothetical protein UR14_C0002G0057 [candidate division TM6 bacterium GW2011_GWE2_31_21]KKP53854.1 MAG: hypothetical protein UR43_C0002G0057 [candidate division TM6 bacterium GW2011_GWF2_33_332]HBS47633.1 hypothetical protein [Candidatus Dependentiae bacterium]HBZ73782.1 hypothetical protein [Candidatus Dependentiae bacterium]